MSTPHNFGFPSGKIFHDSFVKIIGPHRIQCGHVYSHLVEEHTLTFPCVGYANVYMTVRDDFEINFENYPFRRGNVGQINIGIIITGDSIICRQRGNVSYYTMRWHPVMVYHMLKQPLHSLVNICPPLTDILPKQHKLLNQLEDDQACKSWHNPHLEKVLLELFPPVERLKNDPIYHAVNLIAETNGRIKISALAEKLNINERTLNRQFLKKVGVSPKSYAKIWQLQFVAELLNRNPTIKLQDLAFLAGLYDVAHLINDFKVKTNMTPDQYKQLDKTILSGYFKC